MKRILLLLLPCLILITACHKKKAEASIEGHWKIYFCSYKLKDNCKDTLLGGGGTRPCEGTAYFHEGEVLFSYEINKRRSSSEDLECIPGAYYEAVGNYAVSRHRFNVLNRHRYQLDLDGDIWDAEFNGSGHERIRADTAANDMILSRKIGEDERIEMYLYRL